MHRLSSRKNTCNQIFQFQNQIKETKQQGFDAFISHRGIDTKRNVALLIYDYLKWVRLQPFLDCKNLKPGDELMKNLDMAVLKSKVGIPVFSPHYCESYFCCHELSLMIELNKRVIPIYCDVKPNELKIKAWRSCSTEDLERYNRALHEAKERIAITFDTYTG